MAGRHAPMRGNSADPESADKIGGKGGSNMTNSTLTLAHNDTGKPLLLNLPTVKLNAHAKKQLRAIYTHLGGRILCSIRLRFELGEYVKYREAGSEPLDTLGQTLRFDEHLAVCMVKVHGQWIVTDVWELTPVAAFVPVTVWKQVQEGIYLVMRKVLVGWRTLMRRPLPGDAR